MIVSVQSESNIGMILRILCLIIKGLGRLGKRLKDNIIEQRVIKRLVENIILQRFLRTNADSDEFDCGPLVLNLFMAKRAS
jgi:hypothetical protein